MQRRSVAREINPDVLINIPAPHFRCRIETSMSVFFLLSIFFLPTPHVCECVLRTDEHTGRTDKKKKSANKHASHITRELPLAWLLIKPAAPIRDYKD